MGGHHEVDTRHFLPQQRRGKVDCVEGPELGGHGLGGPVEDECVNFDEFERGNKGQDRCPPLRDLAIGEIRAQPEAIQRAQALRHYQRARDASVDLSPFWQEVWLAERHAE
jgi:hypothetical protein